MPAPTPTPATTRQRAADPRDHACDSASNANIADAGAAGYSVTVAQPAPNPTPATTRQRAADPRDHACDSASNANIADAGAAGYSVTVAHPAANPTTSAQSKSPRALELSRSCNEAANANTRQAPTSACAQNNPA